MGLKYKKATKVYLRFVAWDKDLVGADDVIGLANVDITNLLKKGYEKQLRSKIWTKIDIQLRTTPNGPFAGDLSFLVSYDAEDKLFHLKILNAVNLLNPDIEEDDEEHPGFIGPILVLIVYVAVGEIYYGYVEGWNSLDILYFAFVVMTTVGYGDQHSYLYLETYTFTTFYVLLGFSVGGFAISKLIVYFTSVVQRETGDLMRNDDEINSGEVKIEKEVEDTRFRRFVAFLQSVPKSVFMVIVMILVGTMVASFSGSIEASDHVVRNFGESFYFVVVTMSTVGFGDYSPVTDNGKLFAIFWLSLGTVAMAKMLGDLMDLQFVRNAQRKRQSIMNNCFRNDRDFIAFDEDGDNEISELEFVITMLVKLKICHTKHIDEIRAAFRYIDTDSGGTLSMDEIKNFLNPSKDTENQSPTEDFVEF